MANDSGKWQSGRIGENCEDGIEVVSVKERNRSASAGRSLYR